MKKRKNKLLLFCLIFFTITIVNNPLKAAEKNNQEISFFQKKRLDDYIGGSFFSYVQNTTIRNSTGLYFFLSRDGQYSTIGFCPDFVADRCIKDHVKFRTEYRCKKISKQKCKLIYTEKKFVLKNTNEKKFFKSLILLQNLNKNENELTSEIRAITYQENSSDQDFNN